MGSMLAYIAINKYKIGARENNLLQIMDRVVLQQAVGVLSATFTNNVIEVRYNSFYNNENQGIDLGGGWLHTQ